MNTFAALADPTRLRIYELIVRGEMSVTEIVANFSFKVPTISEHLRILRQTGLVRVRRSGQRRLYSTDETALLELEGWLHQQRALMHTHIDALEQHLNQMD
jgi:DNA-binding transcriptional ArsR family regulator